MEEILFWILAGLSAVAGLVAVTRRNPLSSALALAVSLIAVAGLFAMLEAHLLFILQILVYAGAIVVLIVFVIMMLNLGPEDLEPMRIQPVKFGLSAILSAAACAGTLLWIRDLPGLAEPVPAGFGTAAEVSKVLFGPMLLGFEVVGLILLVGILGAVVLAKRED